MRDFREYDICIDTMEAVENIHRMTDVFSFHERFSLTSQIGRSVISIPSNITEVAS